MYSRFSNSYLLRWITLFSNLNNLTDLNNLSETLASARFAMVFRIFLKIGSLSAEMEEGWTLHTVATVYEIFENVKENTV